MKLLQQQLTALTGSQTPLNAIAANKLRRQALDIQAKAYHDNILAEQMLALASQIRITK